jgi:hypothetical protein
MKKLFCLGIALIAISCNKNEPSESLEDQNKKSTDPVIEKYSEMGFIVKASDTYGAALQNCDPSLGIYLFTPDNGPFAGQACEVYRYQFEADISGPCDGDFNLEYQENYLQGYKFVDCPSQGDNCYTFQGPTSCVIVYCDENEVD